MQPIVNLTPHPITLYSPNGMQEIPPSGQLARIRSSSQQVGEAGGVPIIRPVFDEISGLPDPAPETLYIVSSVVLTALRANGIERDDLIAPGTSPNDSAVRDPSSGKVIGITRFVCN